MLVESILERVFSQSNVVCFAVVFVVFHFGAVHYVFCWAFSLQWARFFFSVTAISYFFFFGAEDLLVVLAYDTVHVWHVAVTNFNILLKILLNLWPSGKCL